MPPASRWRQAPVYISARGYRDPSPHCAGLRTSARPDASYVGRSPHMRECVSAYDLIESDGGSAHRYDFERPEPRVASAVPLQEASHGMHTTPHRLRRMGVLASAVGAAATLTAINASAGLGAFDVWLSGLHSLELWIFAWSTCFALTLWRFALSPGQRVGQLDRPGRPRRLRRSEAVPVSSKPCTQHPAQAPPSTT